MGKALLKQRQQQRPPKRATPPLPVPLALLSRVGACLSQHSLQDEAGAQAHYAGPRCGPVSSSLPMTARRRPTRP